jgi:hypothetical protein
MSHLKGTMEIYQMHILRSGLILAMIAAQNQILLLMLLQHMLLHNHYPIKCQPNFTQANRFDR